METEKQRVVYLGAATLKGGKTGSLFIPLRVLLENPTESYDMLRRVASAYDYKPSGVIGGVYETTATFECDSIVRLGAQRTYISRSDHPAIAMFEAVTRTAESQARAKSAEKRAKAAGSHLAPHIDALAQLVAKAGLMDGDAMVTALAAMIRVRAWEIRMKK